MKPREQRETGQEDLFRSRLDQIIDLKHPLVKLRLQMDWPLLEKTYGAVYTDVVGRPPLPPQLMAGLEILKYAYNLSMSVFARPGSKILTFNTSAARSSSGTPCPSTAPP